MSSDKDLAPFYSNLKKKLDAKGITVKTENKGAVEKTTYEDGDVDDGPSEEERYAEERRSSAWWGNKPNEDTADQQERQEKMKETQAKLSRRSSQLFNSAHVLETLMRQTAFQEGDQELLASAFEAIDEDKSGRIDYDEFWEALEPITNNLREQDKQELFMKVDQDCSGAVDLFDFLNFFLVTTYDQLQRPATRSGTGAARLRSTAGSKNQNQPTPSFFPTPKEAKPYSANHKDIILGIYKNKHTDHYATVSRDGVLSTWSTKELRFQRSFKVADPRQSLGGNRLTSAGFIAATCQTPITSLIAVASMKRIIRLYDLNAGIRADGSKKDHEAHTATPIFQFKPSSRSIMCMHCCAMENGAELLMRGSDEGTVDCQLLKPGWHRVEGASMGTYNDKKFKEDFSEKFNYKPHESWVTKVDYVNTINSVVTTGYDNVLAMLDLESRKIKWRLDSSRARNSSLSEAAHTRGIRTWDFSRQFSVFCTGGVERTIQLWSPFVNRPVGALRGSNSSAVHIIVNDPDYQIITLGSDKTIKVWDVRKQLCVGTVTDSTNQLPENSFCALMYDRGCEQLVTGSGRPQMYTLKRAVSVRETYYSFVSITVCSIKNLVAVADESNEVRMYRCGSGRGVSSFCGCQTNGASVTSMAFDCDMIRLLVAANDGFIRLFNHGNGMLLKQFALTGGRPDVAAMQSTKEQGERLLYAATDAKELYVWKDTDDATSDRPIPHAHLDNSAHDADVVDVCVVPPESIITCSFDGKVVVWAGQIMVRSMQDPANESKPIMVRGMLKLVPIAFKSLPPSLQKPDSPIRGSPSRSSEGNRGAAVRSPGVHFALSPSPGPGKRALPVGASPIRGGMPSPMRVGSSENTDQSLVASSGYAIASAGSDGHVHLWDVFGQGHLFKVMVFKPAKSGFGVVQMCTDHTNSFLFCGDAHGIVKVLDISLLQKDVSAESVIPLYEFRAHERSLIGMDFVQSSGKGLDGSGALVTATKQEMRLWTIEGKHIGQFGRDNWDLTTGHRMPLRVNDIPDVTDIEEDNGITNAKLSELWTSPERLMQEDIPENMSASWESSEGRHSPDDMAEESHVNYFASEWDTASLVPGKPMAKTKVATMPRAWIKPKRLDINMFGRIPLTDLVDTQWLTKGNAGSQAPPPPQSLPRLSKHRVRMDASIRELRHTPVEVRPGLLNDGILKPGTPEIYGLSRPRIVLPDRSHTSML